MNAITPSSGVYLRSYLSPLADALERPDVTDIYINRPGEIWVETLGGAIKRNEAPELTAPVLDRISRQVASASHQGINREHPLLSASLPDGSRIQIVAPPATRGDIAIAIRKHITSDLTLDDYSRAGALDDLALSTLANSQSEQPISAATNGRSDISVMLREAVRGRKNILISGGTSSGKTTFLNALIQEIRPDERLIYIEDTAELQLRHENSVGLLATRSALGEAAVTTNDLLTACLRMRPDRIILGELRGIEAFAFLRAVNTGHPGSMTTIHADSPARAIEQLVLLVLQGGTQLSRDDVRHYVTSSIDLYIQLSRTGGKRLISEVAVGRPS